MTEEQDKAEREHCERAARVLYIEAAAHLEIPIHQLLTNAFLHERKLASEAAYVAGQKAEAAEQAEAGEKHEDLWVDHRALKAKHEALTAVARKVWETFFHGAAQALADDAPEFSCAIDNLGKALHPWLNLNEPPFRLFDERVRKIRAKVITKLPNTPGGRAAAEYARRMNPACCMPGHLDWEAIIDAALQKPESRRAFEQAFAATGYQYGEDALEQVRLGWELARGEHTAPPVVIEVEDPSWTDGYNAGYAKKASEADAVTTGMLATARMEGYTNRARQGDEALVELRAKYNALVAAARHVTIRWRHNVTIGPEIDILQSLLPQPEPQVAGTPCTHSNLSVSPNTETKCQNCGQEF